MIELGKEYIDKVTGFKGTATAITNFYKDPVPSIKIEAPNGQGSANERWFADERLEEAPNRNVGFDRIEVK